MHALQDYANRNRGDLARKAVAAGLAYLLLVIYVGYSARSDDQPEDTTVHAGGAGQSWYEALYGVPANASDIEKLNTPTTAPAPPAAAAPPVVVNIAAPPAASPQSGQATQQRATTTTRPPATPRGTANGPAAPTIRITEVEPEEPRVGYETRVKIVAGDLDGIVRAYAIDWGDGNNETVQVPDRCGSQASEPEHSFPALTHTYDEFGDVTIRVIVYTRGTCDVGAMQTATDSKRVTVRPYTPVLPSPGDS